MERAGPECVFRLLLEKRKAARDKVTFPGIGLAGASRAAAFHANLRSMKQ
jgi:hypothetical protein